MTAEAKQEAPWAHPAWMPEDVALLRRSQEMRLRAALKVQADRISCLERKLAEAIRLLRVEFLKEPPA